MLRKERVNKRLILISLILFTGFAFTLSAYAQENRKLCSREQGKYRVKSIKTIKEYGKSLDWSHKNNLIASAKRGRDGYYDVFVMNPDGTNEIYLTHNKAGCPQKHNGNPAWHPSGDYIVFTAERRENPSTPKAKEYAVPGTGFGCDLWVMTNDGEEFYQLTDYPITRPLKAVIHPQFSHEGKKLLWAERITRGESFSGGWALKMTDFVVDNKGPHLENIRTYQPGKKRCFYESHAFSKDDRKILFSGDLKPGQSPVGLDIYELNLETNKFKRLTESDNDWDEHAHYSPDGTKIAWMSSTGFDIEWGDITGHNWQKYLKTELWIMDADGSNKQRLTYFNTPGHPEYIDGARCVVSDNAWSPDGKGIVALVAYETRRGRLRAKIVMIEFEEKTQAISTEPLTKGISYNIKTIKENTERVDWCPKNNMIAFDKKGKDFYYDVYIMNPDGTGEKCLTCDKPGLPNKHMGNPAWHPSGEFIAFTAEKRYHPNQRLSYVSRPGYGFNCDTWIISGDGKRYWKLRETKPGLGSYSPHFSHDGTKLGWSECYERYNPRHGDPYKNHKWRQVIHWEFSDWRVNIANFKVENGKPKIKNIRQYRIPGKKGVHEFHGFSPDDKEILLTGITEPGRWKGPDIYRINLATGKSKRLTFTPENWDEHAHYTPDMKEIVWVSTSGLNRKKGQMGLDFWKMDRDGKNKQRVTFFNTPDYLSSHNFTSVSCADWTWFGSDGRKIIVDVWEDYAAEDTKAILNPGGRTITFPQRKYSMKLIEFAK